MKKILLLLLIGPGISFAQKMKISGDTLTLNAARFIKGNSVEIGNGSKSDGGYSFIFVAPQSENEAKAPGSVAHPTAEFLTTGWKGKKMKITGFKVIGNQQAGQAYFLLLSGGDKTVYMCDPILALQSKEILE